MSTPNPLETIRSEEELDKLERQSLWDALEIRRAKLQRKEPQTMETGAAEHADDNGE